MSSRLGLAIRRLENSLYQPSSERVPFSNRRRIKQRKERDELRLSFAVPKIQQVTDLHDCLSYRNIFSYSLEPKMSAKIKYFSAVIHVK